MKSLEQRLLWQPAESGLDKSMVIGSFIVWPLDRRARSFSEHADTAKLVGMLDGAGSESEQEDAILFSSN